MVSNVQYSPPCTKYHLQGIALILVAGINKDLDINMDVGINMDLGINMDVGINIVIDSNIVVDII